jgi:hypothetical protein
LALKTGCDTLLPLYNGLDLGYMLRHAVICLALVYLTDNSWMISMDVVIHPMRCGLAIVLRCRRLSKVSCGGEG